MRGALGLCVLSGLSALMLSACVGAGEPGVDESGQDVSLHEDVAPTGKGFTLASTDPALRGPEGTGALSVDVDEATPSGEAKAPTGNLGASTITYHANGKVITGTTHIYIIWYGTWSAADQGIITNYVSNIGGSAHYNINTTYYQTISGVKTNVSNSLTLAGQASNNYAQGKNLSDANIQTIVTNAISGGLTKDTNGIYLVLTAADVNESSGFCSQYCGWHDNGTISGSDIKYAFIGNSASLCLASCNGQPGSTSPNNSPGVDAMISVIQHEIEEAVTDPDLNAWYDSQGYENGDKCAWIFGTTSAASNGSLYNLTVGGKQYLVQQNWSVPGKKCVTTY